MQRDIMVYVVSSIFELSICSFCILIGKFIFGVPVLSMLSIYATFLVASFVIGGKMHFKPWYQCAFWSMHLLIGLCYVYTLDLYLSYLLCIIFAFTLSHKADVKITQWNPKGQSKYQKEIDYVKYNPICPDLIAFEDRLKSDDNLSYMCYQYIFRQGLTWDKTAENLMMDSKRLCPIVDKISFGIRLSCHL